MADLSRLVADRDVVAAGEWVAVGIEPNDFEIKTRGFTAAYRDELSRKRRLAAREANRYLKPGDIPTTPDALPPSVDDRIQGEALAEHCFQDVRGLTAGGQPVTADQFAGYLRNPDGKQFLLVLAIGAATRVGVAKQAVREDAEGNFSTASATA